MPPTDPAPSDEAVFLCDRNVNEHTKEVDRRITLVGSKRLSVTSMQYDIDGDGVLDEAEQAMRDMDKEGKGHLSNDAVYVMMKDQMQLQKELFKFKKVVAALVIFVFLLALSNLGTSFAATFLAKDTATNASGELVSTSTKEALATQTTVEHYGSVDRIKDAENSRQLCSGVQGEESEECEEISSSYLAIDASVAAILIDHCEQGKTVYVKREWLFDGSHSIVQLCHPSSVSGRFGTDPLTMELDNGVSLLPEGANGNYIISGDALTQDAGQVCDVDEDCDAVLTCEGNTCEEGQETSLSIEVAEGAITGFQFQALQYNP